MGRAYSSCVMFFFFLQYNSTIVQLKKKRNEQTDQKALMLTLSTLYSLLSRQMLLFWYRDHLNCNNFSCNQYLVILL